MEEITQITPSDSAFDLRLREIWRYRDLFYLFIRREITVVYKQTVLGPLWYIVQPVLTTLMFTLVFGRIAKMSTDGVPQILFYLSGITAWNYFAESLRQNSETFYKNAELYKKVYFPRVIIPLAVVTSGLLKFLMQFALFLVVLGYFLYQGARVHPNLCILLLPLYVFITACLGLALGLLVSASTAKYRDLKFLVQFGVQLWMYATPIIYPLSSIPERYKWILLLNPMTSVVEGFKFAFLGAGEFSILALTYSAAFTLVISVCALFIFNRVERNVIDTV